MRFSSLFYGLIHREVEHSRHRAHLFAHTLAGADEYWIHKGFGRQVSFAHNRAQLLAAAQSAKAGNWESHVWKTMSGKGLITTGDSNRLAAAKLAKGARPNPG